MKPVHVFLLCYNEEAIIRNTINFYRKMFPNCSITIFDNESTDNSVDIAKSLGCNIIYYQSGNIINDFFYLQIKNNCFKMILKEETWVIVADMDEYLCINEKELEKEELKGTTILKTKGYQMVDESDKIDLSDLNFDNVVRGFHIDVLSKNLCFLYPKITDINYSIGAHGCSPIGTVKYSENIYKIKHMKFLGKKYIVDIHINRYNRSVEMRKLGMCYHYSDNENVIINEYYDLLKKSKDIFIE